MNAGPPRPFSPFPRHIAIILDGNRRWAEQRGLAPIEGHRAGLEAIRRTVRQMGEYQLEYFTFYSFSTENWKRPEEEVTELLRLFEEVINRETPGLHRSGVRLRHLGRIEELSPSARQAVKQAEQLTRNNTGLTLSFAFNYGARAEIVDAVRHILADGIPAVTVDEKLFSSYLYTAGLPDVDLLIRTGGEFRLSNFLMWQSAYSELYFTSVLWPDFSEADLDAALLFYSQRQRRFGGG
ncbi:MAG: di-trans,poly-cis-decaprenylcistransferase [Chloroflexi bacterium]|nr:di-trans,poly-cis-decaprenylcistransferase [Chloroflexota bacterium]